MDIAGPDDEAGRVAFRRRTLDELAEHGRRAGVAYAEPFKRIDDL
jgi:hypothetical protein